MSKQGNNNYNSWTHNYSYRKTSDTNTLPHKYITLAHKNKHIENSNKLKVINGSSCFKMCNSQDFYLKNWQIAMLPY